jgi:CrcB protein
MNIGLGFLLVFIGSGIGGMLRHAVWLASLKLLGPTFPYGTLAINVTGAALMGIVIGLFAARGGSGEVRLFLTTGVIGGFTTWSAFTLDVVTLWERGQVFSAAGYAIASFALSLAVLFAMMVVARRWG